MASLNSLYIKKETLKTLYDTLCKKTGKEGKGVELTISLSDETNQYDQNVSAWVSQTKEQREAGKDRYFVGNGKTFWTNDGELPQSRQDDEHEERGINDNGDLPF